MTQTQKYLRIYIRVQAILLCLTLGAFGACFAAERTRYIAGGAPAVSAQAQTVETLSRQFADKHDMTQRIPYLAALPAPYGCVIGIVFSAQEWIQSIPSIHLVIVHK